MIMTAYYKSLFISTPHWTLITCYR